MQLIRYSHNPILEKNPDRHWEAGSVFNPTVWQHSPGLYGMLYRATNDTQIEERGRYLSSIGLAWSKDGITWERQDKPLIEPDKPYENRLGCEDPRITRIDDTFYIFYTAVGGSRKGANVRIALASTTDFKSVKKFGVVGPNQPSKAAALLPFSTDGTYKVLWSDQSGSGSNSRIICTEFSSITQLTSADYGFWASQDLQSSQVSIPSSGIFSEQEVGAVPIKTPHGWLLIYSGFSHQPAWTICAALLDNDDPKKVLAYSASPILAPEVERERIGVMNNVCFPEGALLIGEELYVYYGSGDQGICLATCRLQKLLDSLQPL